MNSTSDWIIKNSTHLDLKIEDLQWIKQFDSRAYDIVASICINECRHYGRGHAADRDLALTIAISEAIERSVGLSKYKSSNGIATHTDINLARRNALYELLERDLFLSHFLSQTPLIGINQYEFLNIQYIDFIKSYNDTLRIFSTMDSNFGTCYVVLISGEPKWGGILGLSFGKSQAHELIGKAFFEAFRQYYHKRNNNLLIEDITLDEFNNLKSWSFTDHERLLLNVDYFKKISILFSPNRIRAIDSVKYNSDEFNYETLDSSDLILNDSPFFTVRAWSEKTQSLVPGPFQQSEVSKKGLSRFLLTDKECVSLELPHPIN